MRHLNAIFTAKTRRITTRTDVVPRVSNNCLLLTSRHIFDIDQAELEACASSGTAIGACD
jgi:hypothetical protein